MIAITGPELSRPAETLALLFTATATLLTVLVPVFYVILLPSACLVAALAAPHGRRVAAAMAVWFPLSAGALLSAL